MNKIPVAFLLLLFTAPSLFPAGFRVGFMDSFAVGRGNAFAATADNPSAIFYNPGGLSQLEGSEISGGVYAIQFSSRHTAPNGEKTKMRDQFTPVPLFYYGQNIKSSPFSFGVGTYLPFGLVTEWPDDAPFRAMATNSELIYQRINPVVSYQVNPQLSIGGGPTFNYTEIDLNRRPNIGGEDHDYRLKGDDTAVGFNAGVHWQPHRQHAFGLSYHSPTRVHYRGSDRISGPFANQKGSASIDSLTFPEIVIAGYSYRPTRKWNLEVNVDWTNSDRIDSTTVRSNLGDEEFPLHWSSTFFYGAGATRYLRNNHFLSAGYLYAENAVPSETFHPFLPDSRLHFFNLGFGSTGKPLNWQAGYQYGYGPSRNIRRAAADGSDGGGRYENEIHALTFTLGYTF